MAWDELRQPLRKRSVAERLWARRPSLIVVTSAAIVMAYAGGLFWALRNPLPFAGGPIITAVVPPPEKLKTVAAVSQEDAAPATQEPAETEETGSADTLTEAVSHADEDVVITSPSRRPLTPAPVSALSEKTDDGILPRIGPDNAKASDVYARTVPMAMIHTDQPRIAIVLGGMGLNAKLTEQASKQLPGDVTFAFAPYGNNLQAQVNKARAEGHEVMLQLPMEPIGYPLNNPGPRTLLAEADAASNVEALRWHMSRFAGYIGITNYQGGKMLGVPPAMRPILTELQRRGLLYLEDGGGSLTASEDIAKQIKLPSRRSQIIIDADPSPAAVKAALDLLETEARNNGSAVGTGSGLPATIEAVDEWAKTLRERGILLVPASALYKSRLG